MKRVLTYGTFDLLHYGHIRLLKRAKELGDYLIVAVSTDEFNAIKGKKSYYDSGCGRWITHGEKAGSVLCSFVREICKKL